MRKQLLLLKTLLVAMCLFIGTNAWAVDVYTTVYQKTNAEGNNQWAAADVTAWGSATNLAIDATTTYFGFAQTVTQNKNGSASYTISSIKDYAKVKYEAEWYVKNTNGGYGACYSYLKLGNLYIRVTDSYKSNNIAFSTDGGTTYCSDLSTKKTESWVRDGNIVTVTAILNTADNTVESMSVEIDGTTYTKTNLTTTTLSGSNNKIIGLQSSTTRSGSSGSQLKSITVSQCEQEVTTADYTINYIYNEETIKTVSDATSVGATVYAESPVTISNTRYYAKDGEVTSMEITSGTNVLNVEYRLAGTYGYTVKAIDGSNNILNGNLASGSVTEGDDTTVKYPRYVLSGTTLYASGSGAVNYKTSFTPDADNYVKNITYNSGTVSNVVFYTEGESITGASIAANEDRASKGQMGHTGGAETYLDVTTLTPGKYKIYLRGQNGNSASRTFNFKVGNANVFTGSIANGTNLDQNSSDFTVSSNSTLSFACEGSQQSGIDYFYVVKTSVTVNFTLGADAGDSYKSYVTTGNTDFAATGVTAYIAKAADTTNGEVTLSTIATAPANTPVLLKGTKGGTAEIATTTTTYSAPETNYLKAADGETAIGSNDAKYVLAYDNGWEFRHYNGTLSAGKVYLDLSTMGARATKFSFVFDDKTTGISDTTRLKDKGQMTNGVFNLKGQRVKKAAKGLYIVNGKKYVK